MRLKKLDPNSPEVIAQAVEKIRQMTPQERMNFLYYRTPGVQETDMTGMYGLYEEEEALEKPREPAEKMAA